MAHALAEAALSLHLSAAEVAALREASSVLLSPLRFARLQDWTREVRRATEPLLHAEQSLFMLPLPHGMHFDGEHDSAVHVEALAEHGAELAPALGGVRRAKALEVFHWATVFEPREMIRTAFYQEIVRPLRLFEPSCVAVDASPDAPPCALNFYRARDEGGRPDARALAILELMLPAFRAGVEMACRHASRIQSAAGLVDTLGCGAAVFDESGTLVHMSSRLSALLLGDPERERVRRAVHNTGCILAARSIRRLSLDEDPGIPGATSEVRTARHRYAVRGCYLPGDGGCGRPHVLVTCEPISPALADDHALRRDFALSERQVQVARLLATGASNEEIASRLGVSIHTARRHVEHVLQRLHLHRRGEVAPVLMLGPEASPASKN